MRNHPYIEPGGDLDPSDILPLGVSTRLRIGQDAFYVEAGFQDYSHNSTNSPGALDPAHTQANASGFVPSRRKRIPSGTIKLSHILNVVSDSKSLQITFARQLSKKVVRPEVESFSIANLDSREVETWAERLLERAYGLAQRQKRLKVLVNPFGGTGNGSKLFAAEIEPILRAALCHLDVQITDRHLHATNIAAELDIDAYDAIVCCSGDGVPHEVINGLAKRADAGLALRKLAISQIPCGSGNALSWNLNGTGSPSLAALNVVKGLRMSMDLASITYSNRRQLSFLSQSFGIIAEADLATEHLRWMGSKRFDWGVLSRLVKKRVWPCEIAVKTEVGSKSGVREYYKDITAAKTAEEGAVLQESLDGLPELRWGTVNDKLSPSWEWLDGSTMGNFYCGNMVYMSPDAPFFPYALPNDGCLDLIVSDGKVARTTVLKAMLSLPQGKHIESESLQYTKISAYRLTPKQEEGYISIDGERIPWGPFQVEIHRGLGTVLARNGVTYEWTAQE